MAISSASRVENPWSLTASQQQALPALQAAQATFAPDRQAIEGAARSTARTLRGFLQDRSQPACDARGAAAHYLYARGEWSLAELGGVFERHHSTIIHSRDRIAGLLDVDERFASRYVEFWDLLQ